MHRRVLVTGGNGFIGSVVVRRLVETGHDVVCVLRDTSRTERIDDLPITRARGDVRDLNSLCSAIAGCDATIHLAAPGSWDAGTPALLHDVIERGTGNVLAAAKGAGKHRVVIVSSTAAVNCSTTPHVFDERTPFAVSDHSLHYSHAKHAAECAAMDASARGADVVVVNPAEVYGPGDTALGTAGNLLDFATSTPVLVCAGGTSIVHVDDVANGILAALTLGQSGERYILGGDNLTIRELAELVLRLIGRRARIVGVPNWFARPMSRAVARLHVPMPFNPHVVAYATRYWFVDSSRARSELGVRFRGAEETIRSTMEWLVQAGYLRVSPLRSGSRQR